MTTDADAKSLLLDILRVGLLRIRVLADANLVDACAAEADHLHNLPALIQSFHWEGVKFYVQIEKTAFQESTQCNIDEYAILWQKLESLLRESQID